MVTKRLYTEQTVCTV